MRLNGAALDEANLSDTNLKGASLVNTVLDSVITTENTRFDSAFYGDNTKLLTRLILSKKAWFIWRRMGILLIGILIIWDLNGFVLDGADFSRAEFKRARLSKASMMNANLEKAQLVDALFPVLTWKALSCQARFIECNA